MPKHKAKRKQGDKMTKADYPGIVHQFELWDVRKKKAKYEHDQINVLRIIMAFKSIANAICKC